MTRLALAFTAGAGLSLLLPSAPAAGLALLLVLVPIRTWRRPGRVRAVWPPLVLAVGAGLLAGSAHARGLARCPPAAPGPVSLEGRLLAATGRGTVPFAVEGRRGCPAERVWARDTLEAGVRLRLEGERREGYGRGIVLVRRHAVLPEEAGAGPGDLRWLAVRWQEGLLRRLDRLYGERAPLVGALVLARREGLDPELRQAFARSGVAHLLAISGFHVGVVAGLLYALFRALLHRAGRSTGRAGAWAALASWGYVALLGFPDAASRAAFMLTLVALARLRGRPSARGSALAVALLVLVALDPGRVGSVGFQLSFLGAAGLLAGRAPLEVRLRRVGRGRLPGWLVDGVSAGAAATAATLPVVAWHFEQVSVVGIPATLAASPMVALALPGALATLLLDPLLPGLASFLAGGVDTLLLVLTRGIGGVGDLSWASLWIPREWTALAVAGAVLGWLGVQGRGGTARTRRLVAASAAASLVVGWPLLLAAAGRGTLELRFLDVGQGDAIALRTPRGSWILVDTGPPEESRGPGPVVGPLRRLGVGRLEALILTHPDADHIGGAADVLASLEVGAVLDPAVATGKPGYVGLLEAARTRGVPWRAARAPLRWEVDGVVVEVLHPTAEAAGPEPLDGPPPSGPAATSNDLSVVLLVRWGAFEALLTGDAPSAVERGLLASLPRGGLELLKVGHHGSETSTDALLLDHARPRVAVISAGRGNRYGHPAPTVVARLEEAGVRVRRTDREGTLRVTARADGSFLVVAEGR